MKNPNAPRFGTKLNKGAIATYSVILLIARGDPEVSREKRKDRVCFFRATAESESGAVLAMEGNTARSL
jgi:hypothetical protein